MTPRALIAKWRKDARARQIDASECEADFEKDKARALDDEEQEEASS
jgi:hypothetical protein